MNKNLLQTCLTISRHYLPKHHFYHNGYKHYTFIIQNNKLIEWATNKRGDACYKVGYSKHQMIHSEFLSWKKAKGLLNKHQKFDIINIRLNNKGELRLSKPCECCFVFLKEAGCENIWFSTNDGFEKMR